MKIAPSNSREQRRCRSSRTSSTTLFKRFHLQCNFVLAFALVHYFTCVHTLSLQSDFLSNEIQNQQPFSMHDGVETLNEETNEPMMVSSQSNVRNGKIESLLYSNRKISRSKLKLLLNYILRQFACSWSVT